MLQFFSCHLLARALGFEPRSKVLETSILPLNYARVSKILCKVVIFQLCDNVRRCMDKVPGRTRVLCWKINQRSDMIRRVDYFRISVTWPAPTVRPPSRIANFKPFSMAIGWISVTIRLMLSPGITISVPSGRVTSPVTSVVRK